MELLWQRGGMRKVLLISSSFPPTNVIGAIRPYKLSKYFPRFGWEPIILTPKVPGKRPSGVRIIETERPNIVEAVKAIVGMNTKQGLFEQLDTGAPSRSAVPRERGRVVKLIKDVVYYPDSQGGWYKPAFEAACKFLEKEHVDAMMSTSPSVVSHMVAIKLKRKYDIPWIADFRDLWTQNHYYEKNALIRVIERGHEKRTLSRADVFVAVTNPFAEALKQRYPEKIVHCITNGFDYDDFSAIVPRVTDTFSITYTGGLYNGKRDPSFPHSGGRNAQPLFGEPQEGG